MKKKLTLRRNLIQTRKNSFSYLDFDLWKNPAHAGFIFLYTYLVWQGPGVLMVSVPRRGEKTNAYQRYTSPKQYRTYSSAWTLSYKTYSWYISSRGDARISKDLPTSGQGFALPRHHALHPNTIANDEATFIFVCCHVFLCLQHLLER